MTALSFHPLAELFPLIEGKEFDELVADIKSNGLREAIVLTRAIAEGGQIIDGRNRFRACEAGQIAARFEVLPADVDLVAYVLSKNLHRRHLTDDQRRMVAAKLAALPRGRPSDNFAEREIKREEAAEMLSVDVAGVDRAKAVLTHGTEDLRHAAEQGEITVNAAAQIAKKPEEEQQQELVDRGILPGGARSIMSSRKEPSDSLDYFPTPPWATRALCQHVMPVVGFAGKRLGMVWEPACGEGHMAEVLAEYADDLVASDIFDYGYGRPEVDFLDDAAILEGGADWIISNPPFGDMTEAFVLKALPRARLGVAMFVRLQWLETIGRYEAIFRDNPPTIIAFFAERVNLCKGRWEPDGSTATAYIWLVWVKGEKPRAPFWIPPGQREALTRPDDRQRFTAHPVTRIERTPHDPETGKIIESESDGGEDVPLAPPASVERQDDAIAASPPSPPSEPPPQHGADISVRTDEGSSGPVADVDSGPEVQTAAVDGSDGRDMKPKTAGAGARIAPAPVVPEIDLAIPDDLLRVELSKRELAMLARIRIEDCDRDEQEFIKLARKHPEAATVASQKRLIGIAESQGLLSEQGL